MRKVKYLLLLVLFAIITTGCVKFNANMDIKKDKSMEFSIIYAFDKTLLGEENGVKESNLDSMKKEGFTVEKYSDGKYEGFKLLKKFTNIDEVSSEEDVIYDLSGMMEEKTDNKYIFKVIKGEKKNTYVARFKFEADTSSITDEKPEDEEITIVNPDEYEGMDGTAAVADEELEISSDMEALMATMDLSFSVNLPYSAISSNATTKENDNTKLTWKLNGEEEQFVEFKFELNNNDNTIMPYIAAGAAVIVFIILLTLIIVKRRKNNGPVEPVTIEDKEEIIEETPVTDEVLAEEITDEVVPEPEKKSE